MNGFAVKHGITKLPLTKKCYPTFEAAERDAIRLSRAARYTIEVWKDGIEVGWYYGGSKG